MASAQSEQDGPDYEREWVEESEYGSTDVEKITGFEGGRTLHLMLRYGDLSASRIGAYSIWVDSEDQPGKHNTHLEVKYSDFTEPGDDQCICAVKVTPPNENGGASLSPRVAFLHDLDKELLYVSFDFDPDGQLAEYEDASSAVLAREVTRRYLSLDADEEMAGLVEEEFNDNFQRAIDETPLREEELRKIIENAKRRLLIDCNDALMQLVGSRHMDLFMNHVFPDAIVHVAVQKSGWELKNTHSLVNEALRSTLEGLVEAQDLVTLAFPYAEESDTRSLDWGGHTYYIDLQEDCLRVAVPNQGFTDVYSFARRLDRETQRTIARVGETQDPSDARDALRTAENLFTQGSVIGSSDTK